MARAPERQSGSLDAMMRGGPGAMDVWAVGRLLDVVSGEKIPAALASLQRRMMAEAPASRPTAAQLLRHSYFSTKNLIKVRGWTSS
jgi:serine/threonine protein kinase